MHSPPGPARRETAPGTSSAKPITPFIAAARRLAQYGQGTQSAVLRQRRPQAQGRRRRHACLLMFISIQPIHLASSCSSGTRSGGWSHRAYWGENVIDWGADGTPVTAQDRRPARGEKVGAAGGARQPNSSSSPGTIIDGWAFTQHGGTVYWDKAGIETETPQDGQAFDSLTAWVRAQTPQRAAGLPREHQGDRRARSLEAD